MRSGRCPLPAFESSCCRRRQPSEARLSTDFR
jgi:hypothetical protein